MNAIEILSAIHQGAVDDHFDLIFNALRERQRDQAKTRSNIAQLSTKVGDRIRLTDLSPKYLNGLTGTVTKIEGSTFTIELDKPLYQKRFWNQTILRVPASTVTKETES